MCRVTIKKPGQFALCAKLGLLFRGPAKLLRNMGIGMTRSDRVTETRDRDETGILVPKKAYAHGDQACGLRFVDQMHFVEVCMFGAGDPSARSSCEFAYFVVYRKDHGDRILYCSLVPGRDNYAHATGPTRRRGAPNQLLPGIRKGKHESPVLGQLHGLFVLLLPVLRGCRGEQSRTWGCCRLDDPAACSIHPVCGHGNVLCSRNMLAEKTSSGARVQCGTRLPALSRIRRQPCGQHQRKNINSHMCPVSQKRMSDPLAKHESSSLPWPRVPTRRYHQQMSRGRGSRETEPVKIDERLTPT